jgi:hypothetical protein
MGKCIIFCAADFHGLAAPLEKDDFIIAADGGLNHTNALGITPNGILGDFDLESIELENGMTISVVKYVTMNNFVESKKSVTKSIKESINGDCYIYYDDDDNKRLVFCDYVKGITDTRDWFYLNEYIIDAIHIFKNEKQAQKFIDERLKYFADQDKVVIAEYPQTVSGFFESKESARKSIKEERYNVELSDYSASIVDEETFDKKSDAIQWANDNGRNCYARIWDNEEGKTVKEWKVKSIKESADDNWYKLKMLNEMLDAMEEDEYNIPKLGIYGVTKNIDLDEGAIEALIKYYK